MIVAHSESVGMLAGGGAAVTSTLSPVALQVFAVAALLASPL